MLWNSILKLQNKAVVIKNILTILKLMKFAEKQVKKFIEENNIHTEHYAVFGGALWIDNNQENREKYGNQLKKDGDDGLAAFKKTSKIGRAWTGLGIKEVHKPAVSFSLLVHIFIENQIVSCRRKVILQYRLHEPKH